MTDVLFGPYAHLSGSELNDGAGSTVGYPGQGEAAGLATAVLAMDRLNSFVRTSEQYHYSGLQPHVYSTKAAALASCNELGIVIRRPVFVRVKCGRCSGSGVWVGRYEEQPCRACNGMGTKRLDFTESTIGRTLFADPAVGETLPPLRWHTPRCSEVAEAEEATDWQPRSPGRPMTPTEVAAALNVVEERWPSPLYAASHYVLWLGVSQGTCVFCGVPTAGDLVATFARRGRLHWRGDVCAGCRRHWESTARRYGSMVNLINARMPLPATYADPAVRVWVARHGGERAVKTATPFADWGDSWA